MLGFEPNSRLAMMLRRLRNRVGIAAPRVAIRTELPWHWRALSVVVLAGCSIALAGWIYDAGLRFAGFHIESSAQELAELKASVQQLTEELEQARKIANSSDSRLKIESTAQDRLASQIKSLEEENTRLKADVAMFENLAGNEEGPPGLEISRLQVIPEAEAGLYRFRLLIAQKGNVKDREFRGRLHLSVALLQGAQTVIMELPGKAESNLGQYTATVRRFGRMEGVFRIPDSARIQKVEARLMEGQTTKVTSTLSLP